MRNIFFFVLFCLVAPIGYVIGLASHPNYAQVAVQKKAVLAIDNAFQTTSISTINQTNSSIPNSPFEMGSNSLPPLENIAVRGINNNPLEQGKIINIPQTSSQSTTEKSRFTKIDIESFNDISMPPPTDELSIEIMGEDKKNTVSPHKIDTTPFIKKNTKAEQKTFNDLYADQRKKLPKAPIDGYFRKSSVGKLPISLPNRLPLYQAYGSTVALKNNQHNIGFIIGGLGLDHNLTVEAIKTLPPHVTLSFIPYTTNLQSYIDMARDFGHEVILEIPMESNDFPRADAGTYALLTKDTPKQYQKKIEWLLSRATGYSGVMNYLGNKYLSSEASEQFFQTIKHAGLYFVENTAQGFSSYETTFSFPHKKSDILFDKELNTDSMLSELSRSETLKNPIIIGYISQMTLHLMRNYITSYDQKNIQIIPIHKII